MDTGSGLQQFVMTINQKISPLHFAIKKSVQESVTGDKSCFVLINVLSSAATKYVITVIANWI